MAGQPRPGSKPTRQFLFGFYVEGASGRGFPPRRALPQVHHHTCSIGRTSLPVLGHPHIFMKWSYVSTSCS